MSPVPFPAPAPAEAATRVEGRPGRTASDAVVEARKWVNRVLPDPAICQGRAVGAEGYVTCLVARPFHCPYALGFGYGHYCRHPDRDGIARRTAAKEWT